jgi:hypothetical protein
MLGGSQARQLPFDSIGFYFGHTQVLVVGSAIDPFLQSQFPVEELNCPGLTHVGSTIC